MALRYFAGRGINELSALPDLNSVLRFHPTCPFGHGERHPCILALLRTVFTNEPQAIHRIALTQDARKLGRMALGPKAGAAAKLWPDDIVTTGLVIGEGVETTLAAALHVEHRSTLLRPAWSMIDAGNLSKLPALPGVQSLSILVDNDHNWRGALAAKECAQRWIAAGCEAILLTPRHVGTDFNDVAKAAS
jgi:Toprim domain